MTLSTAVHDALHARRQDIANDLTNTRAAIEHVQDELERALNVEHRLMADLRSIDDAIELLTNLDTPKEDT
jgi:hypothetical protein